MTIVVVDDDRTNLALIEHVLGGGQHDIAKFGSAESAIAALDALQPGLLITDFLMPGMDGIEFVRHLRAQPAFADLPIIMVTSAEARRTKLDAFEAGVTDFVNKPIDPVELRARARALLRLSEAQSQLRDRARHLAHEVNRATADLAAREAEIINRLARAAEQRDHETGAHVIRVANYARLIARQLALPEEQIRLIHLAVPLHDVGKIGVPDHILLKPGPLDPDELVQMRQHTAHGQAILGGSTWPLLQIAADIAASHHERWDGKGYPNGLAGTDIPLAARITTVADAFDALLSTRSYKKAWPIEQARDFLLRERGTIFDPICVDAFMACWPDIPAIARLGDGDIPSDKPASPPTPTPPAA